MVTRLMIFFLVVFFISFVSASTKFELNYSYFGNFVAEVNVPDLPGKLPVVIYNYDHLLDWMGHDKAKEKGYNVNEFVDVFEDWGMICIIPKERYRKVHAIKGVLNILSKIEKADLDNVHMVSHTEAGLMSVMALESFENIKTLTILAPENINQTGYLSIPSLKRIVKNINYPILYIVPTDEKNWKVHFYDLFELVLREYDTDLQVIKYEVDRRWFLSPYENYMEYIYNFMYKDNSVKPYSFDLEVL